MKIVFGEDVKVSPYYKYKPVSYIDGKTVFEEIFLEEKYNEDIAYAVNRQKNINDKRNNINKQVSNKVNVKEVYNIDLLEEEKFKKRKINKQVSNKVNVKEVYNIDLLEEEKFKKRKINDVPKVNRDLEEPGLSGLLEAYKSQNKKININDVQKVNRDLEEPGLSGLLEAYKSQNKTSADINPIKPIVKRIDFNEAFDLVSNYEAPFDYSFKIDHINKEIIVTDKQNVETKFNFKYILNFANIEIDILSFRETDTAKNIIHDYFYSISTKTLITHKKILFDKESYSDSDGVKTNDVIYIGLEDGNILGDESSIGLGIEVSLV